MRAATVTSFSELPRYGEFADPVPGDGDTLIRVEAVGIHPLVRLLAEGAHYGAPDTFPLIPGTDGVGLLADGRRVFFFGTQAPYGTVAELAAVPEAFCLPLPAGLDAVTAAAVAAPGVAASLALTERAGLAPGETVLVLGATGMAGQIAVQLAKRYGAGRVIATGRNQRLLARLGDMGADATVRHGSGDDAAAIADAAGGDIHVIIDHLWGPPAEAAIEAVTRHELFGKPGLRVRMIQLGPMSGQETITLPSGVLRSSGLRLYGLGLGDPPLQVFMEEWPKVFQLFADGQVRLETEIREYPLTDVADAWRHSSASGQRVVIGPGAAD